MIFGSRSEKFVPAQGDPSQLALGLVSEPTATVEVVKQQPISYTRTIAQAVPVKKDHPGRTKLPEHLERVVILLKPPEDITGLQKIGEDITEELEVEPGKLYVNRYVRPKYGKPGKEGVIAAPAPERPLPKAIAGPGLLAQVVIDKYVDHLPLYRQMERFKREGVNIPSSTISDWVSGTCALIQPLYDALKTEVLTADYLHADETPIKVLDKDKKGETHRGYFWVYHNSLDNVVLFDYQEGRGREGPKAMLQDFTGYLHTDGYSVYDFFKEQEGITVLHCMAHARRMFYEAHQNDVDRAVYALERIQQLYGIEHQAKQQGLNAEQRLSLRQHEAVPVLQHLGEWMNQQYLQVTPKSAIGKALGYSIQRWKELSLYTSNGNLNIDNNPVENAIRPVAIGRKNYLFAGSHEAAKRSAMLYSLMGTCKLHEINPSVWMKDVLRRIATHPVNQVSKLLPQHWSPLP